MKQKFLFLCALTLALVACAMDNYKPSDHYDSKAIEKSGRVIEKKIVRAEIRDSANFRSPLFVPVLILGIPVILDVVRPPPGKTSIDIFEYRIEIPGENPISVFSDYPAFNIGDCTKVFLSEKPSYPRMAPGGRCSS